MCAARAFRTSIWVIAPWFWLSAAVLFFSTPSTTSATLFSASRAPLMPRMLIWVAYRLRRSAALAEWQNLMA